MKTKNTKYNFDLPASLQPDWLSTYVSFENESLQNVIGEIENIYGVKVEIMNLSWLLESNIQVMWWGWHRKSPSSITWPHHLPQFGGKVVKSVQKSWINGIRISALLGLLDDGCFFGGSILIPLGRIYKFLSDRYQIDVAIDPALLNQYRIDAASLSRKEHSCFFEQIFFEDSGLE